MNWKKEVENIEKEFDKKIKEENLDYLVKTFAKLMKKSLKELRDVGFDEEECFRLALHNWMVNLMIYQKEGKFPNDFERDD